MCVETLRHVIRAATETFQQKLFNASELGENVTGISVPVA